MKTVDRVTRLCIGGLVLLAVAFSSTMGQTRNMLSDLDLQEEMLRTRQSTDAASSTPRVVAMESVLDPGSYVIGPSDIFSVNVWLLPPQSFLLAVTPEGSLILPTIGEVQIANLTLAEAKARILREIRKRYVSVEASATLVTPRSVVVTVGGRVLKEGSYTLPAYYRVDKAIEEANRLQRPGMEGRLGEIQMSMSMRRILVRHRDGSTNRVDIPGFRATRNDALNPYLREGDVIRVPPFEDVRGTIGVFGEVHAPDRFEYVNGDSLKGALRLAFGFTAEALSDSIELSRLSGDAQSISYQTLDGEGVLEGRVPDIALQPGDRIIVRRRPELRGDYRVRVVGEVRYPGVYAVTLGGVKLSGVIRKAGGFTPDASLTTSEIIRASVEPQGIDLERLESLRGGVSPEDSSYYYVETALRLKKEVLNVDFAAVFERGDSTQDVVLHHNDVVIIKTVQKTVYVFGQVVSPGHVPFLQNEPVEYYIEQAGGLTDRSRSGAIRIVKGRTRQWLGTDETIIEPGDYVWVPKDPELPFSYYMNLIGQTASIIGVAVSVVLLTLQFNK